MIFVNVVVVVVVVFNLIREGRIKANKVFGLIEPQRMISNNVTCVGYSGADM